MTEKEIFALQEQVALFSDQSAFKRLFKHFYTGLFQFAIAIVKEKEAAEELVEDLFVVIWNKRFTITQIANFKVYLYVAIRNRCLNFVNRQMNTRIVGLEQADIKCNVSVPNPEDILIASDLLLRVNKAVLELPPKCRMVYKLVKEDGLSYKEAAKVLDISPKTVENHIATAVRKIAAALNINFTTWREFSSSSRF